MFKLKCFFAAVVFFGSVPFSAQAVHVSHPSYVFDITIRIPKSRELVNIYVERLDTTIQYKRLGYKSEDFLLERQYKSGSDSVPLIEFRDRMFGGMVKHHREIEYLIKGRNTTVYMMVNKIFYRVKPTPGTTTEYHIDSLQLAFDTVSHLNDTAFYYPLRIGNRWGYKYESTHDPKQSQYRRIRVAGDTTLANRKTYRKSLGEHPYRGRISDTATEKSVNIERTVGNRVYGFDGSTEYLRYDFSMKPGDTIAWTDNSFAVMTAKRMQPVLGRRLRVAHFLVNGQYAIAIADSIGLISYDNGHGYSSHIIDAIINWRPYGDTPFHYPLSAGNEWDYHRAEPRSAKPSLEKHKVSRDTAVFSGKTYRVISGGSASVIDASDSSALASVSYVRVAGRKLYRYNTRHQKELLIYDFGMSVGDTLVRIFDRGQMLLPGRIIILSKEVRNVLGRQRLAIRHQIDPDLTVQGDECVEEIADSVGVVFSYNKHASKRLKRFVIDGKTYVGIRSQQQEFCGNGAGCQLRIIRGPGKFLFRIDGESSREAELAIFTLHGQRLWASPNRKENHALVWETGTAPSGVYVVRIVAGRQMQVRRFRHLR